MAPLPRIGITCDFDAITDRRGTCSPRYVLQEAYVAAVEAAGGEPWLLPHLPPERAASVLGALDGVVLSGGGADVPPSFYGEELREPTRPCREQRAGFERALAREARRLDVPLLGVCGGLQILNVALGGTLFQDLGERPGSLEHRQPHDKRRPQHAVEVTAGTHLAHLVGPGELLVNSTHHQLVRLPGEGLQVSATAPDGATEALELPAARFLVGVQWHPESLTHDPRHLAIYQGLVRAAASRRR
jgi:putative glutamine amidotransferase